MFIEKSLKKFRKDKSYTYFPGNTIIHFVDDPKQISILSEIRGEMEKSPLYDKFVLLPVSSYHMTVCDILVYPDLFTNDSFANFRHRELHRIADIDRCVLEDLRASRFSLDVTMVPVEIKARRVALRPKTEWDMEQLRTFREAVAEKLGFRLDPNYTFHISLAYQLRELNDGEKAEMDSLLKKLNEKYLESLGEIKVRFADYTLFNDMSAFGLYDNGREDLGEAKIEYTEI